MSGNIRLNIGSGHNPLHYWVNIDSNPSTFADFYASVPPMPYNDGVVDEVFAGHFLEHLEQEEAGEFLDECRRVLVPGGKLGIVVPDIQEIMRRHLNPAADGRVQYPRGQWWDVHNMDDMCAMFLYSTVQDSHHKWNYDVCSLTRLLTKHGFTVTGEINRWIDPRIAVGAWYQFGLDAVKQ